jgi:hypothetical protein
MDQPRIPLQRSNLQLETYQKNSKARQLQMISRGMINKFKP